jgi:molybdopterin-guanine dinucleotide biosynthesis protein A
VVVPGAPPGYADAVSRTQVGTRWRGEGVAAVVLAGGIGRRFGTDKARAEIGGTRLLDRALATTADFAPVWVAAGTPERAATLKPLVPRHVRVVPDDRPGAGPLGGIATALRLAGVGWVAVLAVDMPLVDAAWWRILMAAAEGRPVTDGPVDRRRVADRRGAAPREAVAGPPLPPAVALRLPAGRWEPLAALYHATLAGEASARAAPGGDASLQRFLTDVGARAVGVDEVPAGTADDLLNVNVPGDAALVERRWSDR